MCTLEMNELSYNNIMVFKKNNESERERKGDKGRQIVLTKG